MPRAQKKEVAALRPMIDMKEIDWNKQQTEYEEHQMCKSNSAKKQACNDWFDNPDSNKKKAQTRNEKKYYRHVWRWREKEYSWETRRNHYGNEYNSVMLLLSFYYSFIQLKCTHTKSMMFVRGKQSSSIERSRSKSQRKHRCSNISHSV